MIYEVPQTAFQRDKCQWLALKCQTWQSETCHENLCLTNLKPSWSQTGWLSRLTKANFTCLEVKYLSMTNMRASDIKCPERSTLLNAFSLKSAVDQVWFIICCLVCSQAGKHEAIVKNVHDLLAKLAWDFSPEQLDHLFDCFKVSRQNTHFIQRWPKWWEH